MEKKRIILSPEDKADEPPPNLNIAGHFKRVGILNPAVVQDGRKVYLFSRLIYEDELGLNSCIVKNQGYLEGDRVFMEKDERGRALEELVFQAQEPHSGRGVEDMRIGQIEGESPLHGFVVDYNGFDTRTRYVRTSESNPFDLSDWEEFGILFPNLRYQEAKELVGNQGDGVYKRVWMQEHGPETFNRAINRNPFIKQNPFYKKNNPFLKAKDCCPYPLKTKQGKKQVILRLKPWMQIVEIDDWEELAQYEFWQNVVSNIDEHLLLDCKYDWERSHIGLAGPPFEINDGVIIPYHGVNMVPERDYQFGFALVDKQNPKNTLGRTEKSVLSATKPWEENGVVPGKIFFSTDQVFFDGYWHFFYGAGDQYIAHIPMTEQRILDSLSLVG